MLRAIEIERGIIGEGKGTEDSSGAERQSADIARSSPAHSGCPTKSHDCAVWVRGGGHWGGVEGGRGGGGGGGEEGNQGIRGKPRRKKGRDFGKSDKRFLQKEGERRGSSLGGGQLVH